MPRAPGSKFGRGTALVVEEAGEVLGAGEIARCLGPPVDGDLSFVVAHVTLFVEPRGELLGDRARRAQQFLAPHHLSDHEVAEELSKVVEDVLRAEEVAERFLVPCLIRLVEAPCVGLVEPLVGVTVERVTKEAHHVFVSPHRGLREAAALILCERVERLVDGGVRFHRPILASRLVSAQNSPL